MADSLKDYFEERGARPLDPAVLAEYERQMREEVIPKIEADIRWQRRARVCLIFHPPDCKCAGLARAKP